MFHELFQLISKDGTRKGSHFVFGLHFITLKKLAQRMHSKAEVGIRLSAQPVCEIEQFKCIPMIYTILARRPSFSKSYYDLVRTKHTDAIMKKPHNTSTSS